MSYSLESHPFFVPWTDPLSGVRSYLLNERVAPVQMPIYFVNPAVSADEKWLWFGCGYPPSPFRRLGVVGLDPDNPFIKVFQEATFHAESPLITSAGDSCYFASGSGVYEINISGEVRSVLQIPQNILKNRVLSRVATHLTLSADGKYLLMDGAFVGGIWFVAVGDIATGEVRLLKEWRQHMNHTQFSPTDPKLFSIAQDWWHDPISGQPYGFDLRIWLMDTDGTRYEPLRPGDWFGHGTLACHEWWDAQGRLCWVDYDAGVFRCDVYSRDLEHIWHRPLCHAHTDTTGNYWCGDNTPYKWDEQPVEVLFFNAETKRTIPIVSAMPKPPLPRTPLHLDPHPHFSPQGTHIVFMTTVRGLVDVAITEVAPLVELAQ
ncbi:hypothetical protein IAD21_05425 [Abditibacteriota bacterium]|nr:hypothetical protein IAD21_05425 [Abditibacteriota bacterium]